MSGMQARRFPKIDPEHVSTRLEPEYPDPTSTSDIFQQHALKIR